MCDCWHGRPSPSGVQSLPHVADLSGVEIFDLLRSVKLLSGMRILAFNQRVDRSIFRGDYNHRSQIPLTAGLSQPRQAKLCRSTCTPASQNIDLDENLQPCYRADETGSAGPSGRTDSPTIESLTDAKLADLKLPRHIAVSLLLLLSPPLKLCSIQTMLCFWIAWLIVRLFLYL